jgi:hypothetical protein
MKPSQKHLFQSVSACLPKSKGCRREESPTYKLLILNSMGSFDSLPDRQAGSGKGGFKAFEIPSFPGKMINPILMLFQI